MDQWHVLSLRPLPSSFWEEAMVRSDPPAARPTSIVRVGFNFIISARDHLQRAA
jgi:hypothetical protein